jgi:hypothetical protein
MYFRECRTFHLLVAINVDKDKDMKDHGIMAKMAVRREEFETLVQVYSKK